MSGKGLKRFQWMVKLLVVSATIVLIYGCSGKAPVGVYERSKPTASIVYEKKDKSGTVTVYEKNKKVEQVAPPSAPKPSPAVANVDTAAASVGYTIQAGAFQLPENAGLLSDKLEDKGLDPYYFKDVSGLYKVRFGNFKSKSEAINEAKKLASKKIIQEYYIIEPTEYAVKKVSTKGVSYLREELVKTSKRYLGVPYKWGGNTTSGIDCSGLTQAVYNLNGVSIPRNSRVQYSQGSAVSKAQLQKGDLVFFATNGGKTVSHVGVYIGNNQFIHAPSRGKTVRVASLSDSFFMKTYVGARTYIKS